MVGRIRHKTSSNITVVLAPTLACHWWHEHGLLVTPNTKISTVCDRQARHLNVFDTSSPANNHSQNSVSKLGIKPTEHFWTQSWILSFYLDLLHLSDRTHVLRQLVIFIKLPSNEIPLLTKWLKNPSHRSCFPCILSWTHSCSDKKSCGIPSYYVFTGFCCYNICKHQLTKGSTMSSKPHLPYHHFVPCWQVESTIIWVWFQPIIMIRHGQIKYQAPSFLSKVLSMQNHQYSLSCYASACGSDMVPMLWDSSAKYDL